MHKKALAKMWVILSKKPKRWLTSPRCEHNYLNMQEPILKITPEVCMFFIHHLVVCSRSDFQKTMFQGARLYHRYPASVRRRRSKGGKMYMEYTFFRLETKPPLWLLIFRLSLTFPIVPHIILYIWNKIKQYKCQT